MICQRMQPAQSALLAVDITSGELAVESDIVSADFTISNAATTADNATTDLTGIISGGKIEDYEIASIPESATVAGTSVTFTATDQAGNEIQTPNVAVFHIDQTDPSIGPLTLINGKASLPETPETVSGTIPIQIQVLDNLTVDTVKVTYKRTKNKVGEDVINRADTHRRAGVLNQILRTVRR